MLLSVSRLIRRFTASSVCAGTRPAVESMGVLLAPTNLAAAGSFRQAPSQRPSRRLRPQSPAMHTRHSPKAARGVRREQAKDAQETVAAYFVQLSRLMRKPSGFM